MQQFASVLILSKSFLKSKAFRLIAKIKHEEACFGQLELGDACITHIGCSFRKLIELRAMYLLNYLRLPVPNYSLVYSFLLFEARRCIWWRYLPTSQIQIPKGRQHWKSKCWNSKNCMWNDDRVWHWFSDCACYIPRGRSKSSSSMSHCSSWFVWLWGPGSCNSFAFYILFLFRSSLSFTFSLPSQLCRNFEYGWVYAEITTQTHLTLILV